jgi:hypothetical protein
LELLAENPEEDCNDKNNVVTTRTLTANCISLAFSHTEEGLDIILVIFACIYSQEHTSIYNCIYTIYTVMHAKGVKKG